MFSKSQKSFVWALTISLTNQLDDLITYVADITETLSAFFSGCPAGARAMSPLSTELTSLYQHGILPAGRVYLEVFDESHPMRSLLESCRVNCVNAFREMVVASR